MNSLPVSFKDHVVALEASAKIILNRCQKFKEDLGGAAHGLRFISPTGQGLRIRDDHGNGHYGAFRGSRGQHKGVDYLCDPGQEIVMPTNKAQIERISMPYRDDNRFSGFMIRNQWICLKLFYFEPDITLIGKQVGMGNVIGRAQNIADKYPGMLAHIHVRVVSMDLEVLK